MEVQFRPELEEKLNELSSQTGRPAGELVEDMIAGFFDDLAAETREMLDSRYDDLKSGRGQPIDGEAFFESLRCREDELLKPPRT
jgi:predicted DNA-binding protein